MRVYTAPTFNLQAYLFFSEFPAQYPSHPFAVPLRGPDATVDCQLYINQRSGSDTIAPGLINTSLQMGHGFKVLLRMPANTYLPLCAPWVGATGRLTLVNVPKAGGFWYIMRSWVDVHKGFPNEYRMGELEPIFQNDTPSTIIRFEPMPCTVIVRATIGGP